MNFLPFQNYIRHWYLLYGRHELPWRQTRDPYHILVSELMLQQTQVERVIPKYFAFLARFPQIETLSSAKLSEVLTMWQGLGYNRRAKYLWLTAQELIKRGGEFPKSPEELQQLPGIGPYTAAAVACFAYNSPVTLIETNVRTIFIYHFFPDREQVSDKELLPMIEASVNKDNPREWYFALMDYGSYLKKVLPNPSRRSRLYNKQSTFTGSKRQVRGEIVRILATTEAMTQAALQQQLTSNPDHFYPALNSLIAEGLVAEKAGMYMLAGNHS